MRLFLFAVFAVFLLLGSDPRSQARAAEIPYSQFVHEIENNQVATGTIQDDEFQGVTRDGSHFVVVLPPESSPETTALQHRLAAHHVSVTHVPARRVNLWLSLGIPLALVAGAGFLFLRRSRTP